MEDFKKEDQKTESSQPAPRDPDFETQEAPDYVDPAKPQTSSLKLPEPAQDTSAGSRVLGEDKETLGIEKPIQALFNKDQAYQPPSPQEQIQLPSKRWSKKELKRMKKRENWQGQSESGGDRRDYSQRSQTPSTNQPPKITPPPLVKEVTKSKPEPVPASITATIQTPETPKFKEPVFSSSTAHAAHSKGIAYVDTHNRVKITGGYRVYPGDVVKIGNHEFMVKEAKRNWTNYYIAGAATLLFLILSLIALIPNKSANSGNISGIVMEQTSRALVPFAVVNIKELGMKVTTNEIGFFNFQMVPQGTYTVEAAVPGYPSIADQATVARSKTSNLALMVAPTVEMPTTADVQNAIEDHSSQTNTRGTGSGQIDSRPGAISLKTNASDAIVLLDNQQIGTGPGSYKSIKAGSHSLRVSQPGYKDWHRNVSVKPGQTLSVSADLEKMTGAETGGLKLSSLDDYLKAAQESYDENEYSAAVKYYNQAAQMTSSRGEVYLGRGLAYSQMGNNKQASNDFLTAAQTYLKQERFTQAAEAYSYYLQLNPQNENLRYQRGKSYLAAGNYNEAAADISQFLESNPKSLNAYLDLGQAYYLAGDYHNSVEAYQKARKLNGMDKRVYIGLTEAYMGVGNRKGCKQYYDKFKELATYVDKEKLKDDPEWKKVLDFLQIREE
ncbi:MAG: hypothetical protein A2Z27_06175 [candidate division Zixibacteria bacterium RBG_16_50_21]|nr:MAG: hypothetical protein A2Z27_06175 [candidate division Zixibacteria bacterium RBG_16_50_21]